MSGLQCAITKRMDRADVMNSNGSQKAGLVLERVGIDEIAANLRVLLADVFVLYVKTKNFHWHMNGAHFRDYHSFA